MQRWVPNTPAVGSGFMIIVDDQIVDNKQEAESIVEGLLDPWERRRDVGSLVGSLEVLGPFPGGVVA